MHPLLKFFHVAGVVLWVGGMFFAWVCLRPVAAAQLPPPQRLCLWAGVFARFFPWVGGAVLAILLSGLVALAGVGLQHSPPYWHAMLLLGLVMMAIFVYLLLWPYAALRRAVAAQDWPVAGAALARIRQLVGINLALGALTIAVATVGPLLG